MSDYPGSPGYPGYPGDPPPPPPPPSNPPQITTVSLANGTIAVPYSQQIGVVNGTAPYTFAVTAGTLPAGLALANTGLLSGTPTASGTRTFIVQVTDANSLAGSVALTLAVPSVPTITNVSLPLAVVGTPYFASLSGQGGAQPYGFRVVAGGLPSGIVLATTGGITGTPTVDGSFNVTIQVYDSNSPQGVGQSSYTITVQRASLANTVTTMAQVVLMASQDGAIYAIVPGQRHDEDYDGNPVGFLQQWNGVPGGSGTLGLMQLGGATVSAKGQGTLNVTAVDDDGDAIPVSSDRRPMMLDPNIETKRDFMITAAPKSERFGIGLNNGGVADAWFEAHAAILWTRPFYTGRKA